MTFETIKTTADGALMPTYNRFPVALVSGKGAIARDADGREYVDFGSGIGVNSLGYCDDGWVKAVSEQAATLQHVSNLYYQPTQAAFANELCAAAGMDRAFLCNSGAEANECAIKLARKYSHDAYGAERSTVITLVNSFHGRTMATLSATGQDVFHQHFEPFPTGFVWVPAGDIAALTEAADDTVCAVMLECIQGEGGVVPLDEDYLRAVQTLCREHDWLLIVDEVQTGASRSGRFLASQALGVRPDVVTMAKGLGGGLPIGACLCTARLSGVMSAGMHGSTFGGNPVASAAGRYVLSRITDPAFLAEVQAKGDYLAARLNAMPNVQEVRGMGLMRGVVLKNGTAAEAANTCLQNGLLILTAKTLLRLLPPLTVTREEMDRGLAILETVLKGMK